MKKIFHNKLKLIITRIVIATILVFSSCSEDFFNPPIGGRIYPSQHYNSIYDAQLSYLGCFVFLQDIAEKQILLDGLLSDQMDVTQNADNYMYEINLHEITPENPYINPSDYYKLVININEVLPRLPQILEKDRDFDSTMLFQFEGSLITLQNWAYFNLARLNGKVGFIEGSLEEIDPDIPPLYLEKEEAIQKLISSMLIYYDPDDRDRFPVDQYALLGEMYLEINDYANAKKYLKYAIDGGFYKNTEFAVDEIYEQDSWEDIFLNSTTQNTTVFTAVPYSFTEGQRNNLEQWMHYDYDYMVKPVDALIDSFELALKKDSTLKDIYRGKGVTYDSIAPNIYYINKYSIDKGIPHSADVILYRAADVHLMLAEALNRLGDHTSAMTLVNNGFGSLASIQPPDFKKWSHNSGVRGRVYLTPREIPPDVDDMTSYIEDLILMERSLELAFEGKRWTDLVRIASRRGDPAYLADRVAAKFDDPGIAETVRSKLINPENWYIPLVKIDSE